MKKIILSIGIIMMANFILMAAAIGDKVDEQNNVAVYNNGADYLKSYGVHYSSDGYCYGQKWQCVEYVIRYYDIVLHHRFPSTYGHARDFWNLAIDQGGFEKSRGLYQYYNDDNEKPQENDILVFPFSKYGHVCIVTKVTDNSVEIIQQNMEGKPRDTYNLTFKNGKYTVSKGINKPAGWLRKK